MILPQIYPTHAAAAVGAVLVLQQHIAAPYLSAIFLVCHKLSPDVAAAAPNPNLTRRPSPSFLQPHRIRCRPRPPGGLSPSPQRVVNKFLDRHTPSHFGVLLEQSRKLLYDRRRCSNFYGGFVRYVRLLREGGEWVRV